MLSTLWLVLSLSTSAMLLPQEDPGIYSYDDYSDEDDLCDDTTCSTPNCTCFGVHPPNGMALQDVPQFVVLAFDGPITLHNIGTYQKILDGRKNPNGCPISATFFLNHEHTRYNLINELYRKGHDIAVQSISKEADTELWSNASETRVKNEIEGMRKIISTMAVIPESEIVGYSAPFLQTAGERTFKVLKRNSFLYDFSLPTRKHMDPPLWPYTLDHGFPQDCLHEPCPSEAYPGLWVFPIVQWKIINRGDSSFCSTMDTCIPQPHYKWDVFDYIKRNLNRHYLTNKAPFPIFTRAAWFEGGYSSSRFEGYIDFLNEVLRKEDVFVVSVNEVLEYMRHPISVTEYMKRNCSSELRKTALQCDKQYFCYYQRRDIQMHTCVPCPKRYPWIGNPEGK